MRKQITGNEEIKLYSWMAQEGLKGNALVVYAIVYDKADEERIKSLEAKILKGGSDEERAVKAIAEAKEYLDIVAKSRLNKHCRVF